MRSDRISAWTLALLVAAAAATKLGDLDGTGRDAAALLSAVGLGRPAEHTVLPATLVVCVLEVVLAFVIASPRRSRQGLVALTVLVSAGALALGSATSWGRDADVRCPCGLPLEVPFVRNTFAAMLVRDALLFALVALAWGPRAPDAARTASPATGGSAAV